MNFKLIFLGTIIACVLISFIFAILTLIEIQKITDYYFKSVEQNIKVLNLTLFDEFKFNNYDIIMNYFIICLIFNFIVIVLNIILLVFYSSIILDILNSNTWFYYLLLPTIVINLALTFTGFFQNYKNKNNINIKSKDVDFLYKFNKNYILSDESLKDYKKNHNFNFNFEINYNNTGLFNLYIIIICILTFNLILLILLIILFFIFFNK